MNPRPKVTGLIPTTRAVGSGAFVISVYGSDFHPQAVVEWNGSPRATTYVSSTQLEAEIQASDLASAGPAYVGVLNPVPGGGLSGAQFTVASASMPESGWWWDPGLSGIGFFLEYGGGSTSGIFLAGFFYDADGKATWMVSTGPIASSTYNASWQKMNGGQTLTGPYRQPSGYTIGGGVSLAFTDSSHAVMTRPDGSKINLQRFAFTSSQSPVAPEAGAPQSGWWWAGTALSGTGYGIEIQGNSVFIVAYVYDNSGNPVWYLATGNLTTPTTYNVTWDVYVGGPQFTSPEGAYSAHMVSSATPMTLTFSDATNGTLTMGSTVIPITRFKSF
jgi:hypothetical protein